MPLFSRKDHIGGWGLPISRDRNLPRSPPSIEWSKGTGLCENWESKLVHFEPLAVHKALQGIPAGKGDAEGISQCGWCLLTAYKLMCRDRDGLLQEKCKLEKENADLISRLALA